MRRVVWVRGRLSWPFVICIAYLTAAIIGFDYVWRVVVIPFDTLLLSAALKLGTLTIVLIGLYGWWQRRNGTSTS